MKLGIERLLEEPALRKPLLGRRVALLAHPASVTRELTHSLDALAALPFDGEWSRERGSLDVVWDARFRDAIADDLDFPKAMAMVADLSRSDLDPASRAATSIPRCATCSRRSQER